MHDLPTTASESARLHRELLNIFDFTRVGGAEPEFGFEERNQQDVDSYAACRYQPVHDEDLNAPRVDPAARIPIYDPRPNAAVLPCSTATGTTTGHHPLAPIGSNGTPLSNAPQSQDAPPVSAVPPAGARYHLALHFGRPSQGLVWPANVEIGIVEICTFCPNWFMIPELVARAVRNGWTREALSKAQLHAIGALDEYEWQKTNGRIQKHISAGCKLINGVPSEDRSRHNSQDFRVRHGPQNNLTASAWRFKVEYEPGKPVQPGHMLLSDVYDGVVNWPAGNDRLLMTQCLEFARNNEHLVLDTSHWDWIIRSQGLTAPPAAANVNRDVNAFQRLNASVADP